MLYINAKTPTGEISADWHVNEKLVLGGEGVEVYEVYADGHELDYIRRFCAGLPDVPDNYHMLWKGALAQFIYDNTLQNPKKYTYG